MAAPQFVPTSVTDKVRSYESPDHVPGAWMPDRPGELSGRQPHGRGLGTQGPDQGYGLTLAARFRDRLHVADGESADDAIRGCLNIALRRAALFGRAPVVHDLTMAFTMWGFLDAAPPSELVALRTRAFEGVADAAHHYAENRAIADAVPESTLRMTPAQLASAYPARYRELIGV
jgi:hypothetical protein